MQYKNKAHHTKTLPPGSPIEEKMCDKSKWGESNKAQQEKDEPE